MSNTRRSGASTAERARGLPECPEPELVAGTIGVDLGLIRPENYVALVAAGLVSVVLFPLLALPRLAGTLVVE